MRNILAASSLMLAATSAFAGAPIAEAPSEDLLVTEAPVTGFINNGDQSVVDTLYVYMDGCPLLSITPPADGKGKPTITMIEPDGDCATSVGLADTAGLVLPAGVPEDSGMHVQLWQDDTSELETLVSDPQSPNALIVEISPLWPDDEGWPTDEDDAPVYALGTAPTFWLPGVFGDPSGSLVPVSNGSADNPQNNVLLASGPLSSSPSFGGGSNGGGGGGGGGNNGDSGLFPDVNTSNPVNPNTGLGSGVAAVPLPATLLLLLWALQMMRSYVRRR